MTFEIQNETVTDTDRSKKRFRRCVLHIGMEKTGTKALQDYLARHTNWLKNQGVLYPKHLAYANASQWEFVAAVHPAPWSQDLGRSFDISDADDQAAFRRELRQQLQNAFDAHKDCDTLLISSEHLQSRLQTAESIELLKAFLDPWVESYEIVVYFRRQDRLALSFLSTRLKSSVQFGGRDPMEIIRSTPSYYDLLAVYHRWSAVFGPDAIVARRFEPEHWPRQDLLQDFCAACQLKPPTETARHLNPSLNRIGFQFLSSLNALYPVTPGDRSDEARNALVAYIEDRFSGRYYPISRSQAKEFYYEHSERNDRLNSLAFANDPNGLFIEDFSDYPDAAESTSPAYEDAVQVILTMWRDRDILDQNRVMTPENSISLKKIWRSLKSNVGP